MRNPFLLLVVIAMAFLNCNGRQTKKEALERAVAEYNIKHSVLNTYTLSPEAYVEVVTDTLIANTISVHIKNYSLIDEQVLRSNPRHHTPKEMSYQRVFESEVSISIASKDIFRTHISAKHFKTRYSDPFWENATLQHVWVNQELSTTQDITLDITFIDPLNTSYKLYRMAVNTSGHHTIDLVEEQT